MFITFHSLTVNGVGSLNSNKDGSPKSIIIGDYLRSRNAGQKVRHSYRFGLQEMGFKCCVQTRELLQLLAPLAKIKSESDPVAAEIFCKDLLLNYLKHKEKSEEDKGKEDKFEIARYSQEEIDLLSSIASKRASGQTIDPKQHDFDPFMKNLMDDKKYDIDMELFGRMRPTPIVGCFKVQTSIGVTRSNEEEDFFTAADDLVRSGKVSGSLIGHLSGNNAGKWVSSSIMYGYSVLSVKPLLSYYNDAKTQTNKAIQACLRLIRDYAPKSESINSPNQGTVTYIMVERLQKQPISLDLAFQNPVQSQEEAIDSLRKYKKAVDEFYQRGESSDNWKTSCIETGLMGVFPTIKGLSSWDDVNKFILIS